MICEEYKRLRSEWLAARGEWIHVRLTAGIRPAGVTEATFKESLNRTKTKMDAMEGAMIVHAAECKICRLEQPGGYSNYENGEKIA